MRKIFLVLLVVAVLCAITVSPVLAHGDQVRGDKSEGTSYQVQNQDPLPFQP